MLQQLLHTLLNTPGKLSIADAPDAPHRCTTHSTVSMLASLRNDLNANPRDAEVLWLQVACIIQVGPRGLTQLVDSCTALAMQTKGFFVLLLQHVDCSWCSCLKPCHMTISMPVDNAVTRCLSVRLDPAAT